MNTIARAMLLSLAALGGHAQAADGLNLGSLTKNPTYFASLGLNNAGYASSGLALKAGVDAGAGLAGVKELGVTAYYAYGGASDNAFNSICGDWGISSHSLAAGPTFTLPLQNSPLAFQARTVLSATFWNIDLGRCAGDVYGSTSGTDIDLGYGVGMTYKLNDRLTLRADWDSVGWSASQFTVGANFKF